MSAAHRAGALAKMKEHHAEAVRLRESGDAAGSRRAAAAATHAADVVRSLDSGTIVGTASSVDFSPSSSVSGGTAGTSTSSSTSTAAATPGAWTGSETAPDVRGGYNPGEGVDMTNTNPAYWASAVRYFTAHPRGNPTTGELGIWIPNLEKEGNERVALAAIAGGVTAHVGSNYSNNTIDNAYAQKLHRDRGDTAGAAGTYNTGGAEKVIRLAGTHRGGVLTDTGYAMGSTAPSEHGVHIKGGKVVKAAGGDYVAGGGDFGGLLGAGTAINTAMLDGLLGPRDSDGMRLGGTYPTVRGAATSDPAAGGVAGGGVGGGYGGISGGGPVVPTFMSDWSKFMPTNFSLGQAMYDKSGAKVAPGGFLYQPHAADYLGGMSTPGGGYYTGGAAVRSGGLLGGSPAVTFTPPTASTGSRPLAVTSAGSSVGTRMGMTPGPHSSHLGAYDRGDGTWVWGTMPSEGGHDPTGGDIAHSVSPMSSLASSPTLGPGAHPMSVAMALAGPMAPTSHTTAPGTYSHEALEAAAAAAAGTAETGGMGAGGMAGGGIGGGVR